MDKQIINPANLISVQEFATLMGKTRQTVFNWVKDGRVSKVKYLGKEWIDKSTLKNVA